MKNLFSVAFLILALSSTLTAQDHTLFDDSQVASIYIEIPADSLAVIMTDVLSDHYFLAKFVFIDNVRSDTLDSIGFRLRGNTSRYSKKKSFKISFNTYAPGRKYQGVKKINLNGQHNDPTMIREKLYYDLWKKAGLVERRTSFVKLFINHVYYGLYTNLEEMDKDWLKRNYPDNNGNLFKCTYPADLVFRGMDQQVYKDIVSASVTGGRAYDLQTNEAEDNYSRLVDLIAEFRYAPDSVFAENVSRILDINKFLMLLALDVGTGNWDDYAYNKNNFYLYDRPDNHLFEMIAYDTDNTFGVDWMGKDWATRNCLTWPNENLNLPVVRKILEIPKFVARYKVLLDSVARFIIEPDSVFPRIDFMKALITPAATADTYRTLDYGYDMVDFNNGFIKAIDGHTPYGIKPFLTKRKQYILQQIHPAGLEPMQSRTISLRLFPNPVSEWLSVNIDNPEPGTIRIEILNHLGDIVHLEASGFKGATGCRINTATLAPGPYIIRVISAKRVLTATFIKI